MISGNSSTCIEAIASAVPVIVIANKNKITQNPIPKDITNTIWQVCYNTNDFKIAFEMLFPSGNGDQKKDLYIRISEEIKRDYFMPVTTESVSKMFENYNGRK